MANEKMNEALFIGMDEAAQKAKEEFDQMSEEVRKVFSTWMRKWYLKAGYRRLGRIAVAYAKALEKK
jgi:alkylhydroperoxidase/carboxymuconolactone decarboxylase family protein YurZ